MGLVYIDSETWPIYAAGIAEIESSARYPLGQDFFKIDHGLDYFAFFKRMGQLSYAAWIEDGRVAAVAAGILRTNPRAWYLCDLKVHPDFRGRQIPLRMVSRSLWRNYWRCPRGYAISMNANPEAPNRVAKLLSKSRWVKFGEATRLYLWSLNRDEMIKALPAVEKARGPVSFLSLAGVKDIVLESTGRPMRLLHLQFGLQATAGNAQIEVGATHMLSTPVADPLTISLLELGLKPSANASVISHRMHNHDWRWVLTSDI